MMMSNEFLEIFLESRLPCIKQWPTIQIAEEQGRNGGRRGYSTIALAKLGTLEIAHFAEPIEPTRESIEEQKLFVWGRLGDDNQISGAVFSHPFGFPTAWWSDDTQTKEEYEGRGVGSSLYAHLHLFGYAIGPSPNLSDPPEARRGGDRLWRSLDPALMQRLDKDTLGGNPPPFTDELIEELYGKFGKPKEPEQHPEFELRFGYGREIWGFLNWP